MVETLSKLARPKCSLRILNFFQVQLRYLTGRVSIWSTKFTFNSFLPIINISAHPFKSLSFCNSAFLSYSLFAFLSLFCFSVSQPEYSYLILLSLCLFVSLSLYPLSFILYFFSVLSFSKKLFTLCFTFLRPCLALGMLFEE